MQAKTLKPLSLSLIVSSIMFLTACGGGGGGDKAVLIEGEKPSSNQNNTPSSTVDKPSSEEVINLSEEDLKEIALPTKSSSSPNVPTNPIDDLSLEGVDKNGNKVRDDLEEKIYSQLNFAQESERVNEYNQAIELIKYIQPTSNEKQVIDQHEFYCKYRALPKFVREKISMNLFQYMVTDTKERNKAFNNRLKRSQFSTGEEICVSK